VTLSVGRTDAASASNFPNATGVNGAEAVAGRANVDDAMPHHAPRPKVSVVIPALNEERNLPHVAARMPTNVDEIVFVNGDSLDNTAAVARDLWPNALHIKQTRRGKGNALACGIAVASGDIIVMIDADGSTDPAEIPRYVGALMGGADYAKGSRFIPGGGSADITKFRRFGNKGLNTLVNVLFATKFTDLCYGYNAFWRRCLDVMCLPDVDAEQTQWGDGFEVETLINARVGASQLKVVEVSSYESCRIHGRSNLKAVADGFRVLTTIRQEFLHLRINGTKGRSGVAYPYVPYTTPTPGVDVDDRSRQKPDDDAALMQGFTWRET
jgi:glycosyltransferase involved in cell wall biosynthesis